MDMENTAFKKCLEEFFKHGFHFTGHNDRVKCYMCDKTVENWGDFFESLQITKLHRTICPLADSSHLHISQTERECRQTSRGGVGENRSCETIVPIPSQAGSESFRTNIIQLSQIQSVTGETEKSLGIPNRATCGKNITQGQSTFHSSEKDCKNNLRQVLDSGKADIEGRSRQIPTGNTTQPGDDPDSGLECNDISQSGSQSDTDQSDISEVSNDSFLFSERQISSFRGGQEIQERQLKAKRSKFVDDGHQVVREYDYGATATSKHQYHKRSKLSGLETSSSSIFLQYPEKMADTSPKHKLLLNGLDLRKEKDRLKSFKKWPIESEVTPASLSRNGFFFLGDMDRTQCFCCCVVLRDWTAGDDPVIKHQNKCPDCRMVQQKESQNIPKVKPRNPDMVNEYDRLKTFDLWPKSIAVTPTELANAGFYFLGCDDRVKCFYCNGVFQNWEVGDIPWCEHAKWFPNCEFLIQTKGQKFVNEFKVERAQTTGGPGPLDKQKEKPEKKILGESVAMELVELQKERMCKICSKESADMKFMPCMHICCCRFCTPVRMCPLCGSVIQSAVLCMCK
uniref:E3 ubiquitin-protein ligase XIAP-like isoform X2 n=1 Tax=Styela clava TaxID=7725 RepID=UPI00193A9DB3|nr:E3 ubiquitin-protein ligase XIAP-like isoform X2 [Styela clava]